MPLIMKLLDQTDDQGSDIKIGGLKDTELNDDYSSSYDTLF